MPMFLSLCLEDATGLIIEVGRGEKSMRRPSGASSTEMLVSRLGDGGSNITAINVFEEQLDQSRRT